MSRSPKVLALIGMRSGSRGVKDKNIRPLAGRPLVGWIIDAALAATCVDRVVVSTDSEDYAAIARQLGAEVPCLRPTELAGPDATDVEFMVHMLDWLEANEGYRPDVVLRLLATSPLQQPDDIDGVVAALLAADGATSAMTVAEARQHPAKALRAVDDEHGRRWLVPYVAAADGTEPLARQRHDSAYFRANIVASHLTTIRTTGAITGDRVACHEVPQDRAVDIDSELDFAIAEFLMTRTGRRSG